MGLIFRLEQKYHRLAIPNITAYWIAGQVLFFLLIASDIAGYGDIVLVPQAVRNGEFWRVLTFMFAPKWTGILWAIIGWYVLYLIGTALENTWGAFRYNLYLLISFLATVAVAGITYFISPNAAFGNIYIQGVVFLAFAFLYPEFQFLLFFVVPVKVKYLAYMTWVVYAYSFVAGNWAVRGMIAAATLSFFVFFGAEVYFRLRRLWRSIGYAVTHEPRSSSEKTFFHRCVICGITDKSHPDSEFRYCSKCLESPCYCMDHIGDHEHVTPE